MVSNIRKTILDFTEADLDRVINLNIKGTVRFFQAFGSIKQQGGSIIARSSVRAVTIEPDLAVYSSTKAAIGLLVKGFASEVGRFGVRVNAIAPSITETALTRPITERPEIYNLYAGHAVLNRWGRADELQPLLLIWPRTPQAMSAAARCSSTAAGPESMDHRPV